MARPLLCALACCLSAAAAAPAAPGCKLYDVDFNGPQLPGPPKGTDRRVWIEQMRECRAAALKKVGYTADIYDRESLKWTQKAFTIPMVQGYERLLFNGTDYTVDTYLNDVRSRYGGVDAVLLWPTYMNIGMDDRDQLDLFEAMPGGLAGLATGFGAPPQGMGAPPGGGMGAQLAGGMGAPPAGGMGSGSPGGFTPTRGTNSPPAGGLGAPSAGGMGGAPLGQGLPPPPSGSQSAKAKWMAGRS